MSGLVRFSEMLGVQHAVELLQRVIEGDRLPHGILLTGPSGVGKGTFARALAATLLCENSDREACGTCSSCMRVASRSHPDLLVVRRVSKKIRDRAPMSDSDEDEAEKDLSNFIRIFQIREMTDHIGFAAKEGGRRVFLVDPADRMNVEAQNALLRTLEEPPGDAVILLVASRAHMLLPTVRSRCFALRFGPMRPAELAEALQARGMDLDEAQARASLSRGRPGLALSLDMQRLETRRGEILGVLEALTASPRAIAEWPGLVGTVHDKDDAMFQEGLDMFEELLRDATRAAAGAPTDHLLDPRLAGRLEAVGHRLGTARGAELIRSIEKLRGQLSFNVNKTLLTEALLASVAGAPVP